MAEGASGHDEAREPSSSAPSMTVPAVKIAGFRSGPAAETGVLPAVVLPAEGTDNTDRQDASRTTAETSAMPVPADAQNGRAPSVLIVEDTAELAEVIQATLERMRMVTRTESHGSKALARYNEMRPDVILLDIGLPDTTGWKLLESIQELERKSGKMPIVIVITAYGDAANRLVGKLQNVHSYLVKPFTADEVERAVSRALSEKAG
jgi:CheY-like chemotaxis protein